MKISKYAMQKAIIIGFFGTLYLVEKYENIKERLKHWKNKL